ncbi:MAG: YicC family protein [Thermodesulfovibrio sp.]|nr:YicC family protein [Thermodesulfovibrio sp.]
MIQSLTGYGISEKGAFRVEIRSLNHKFLEINIKLPSLLTKYEMELRELVKSKFQRGKIDITVSLNPKERVGKIYLNKELAKNLYSAFIELKKELSILGSIDISMFANFRELFIYEEEEPDINNLKAAFNEALEAVERMRIKEGENLKESLTNIIKNLEDNIKFLDSLVDMSYNKYIETLREKIKELLDNKFDENKVIEQIVAYAQKTDIKEEVDRLKSHLSQFRELLKKGGVIGKQLDFILQEMQRESNTILGKSEDISVKNLAISIKTSIERLKEQIQNIQ